jgi:hypothetical protein
VQWNIYWSYYEQKKTTCFVYINDNLWLFITCFDLGLWLTMYWNNPFIDVCVWNTFVNICFEFFKWCFFNINKEEDENEKYELKNKKLKNNCYGNFLVSWQVQYFSVK